MNTNYTLADPVVNEEFKPMVQYAVVDLKERKMKVFETRAQAWGAWQKCWIGAPSNATMNRYTIGKLSNMKGYLKNKPLPLSYQDDGLESRLK